MSSRRRPAPAEGADLPPPAGSTRSKNAPKGKSTAARRQPAKSSKKALKAPLASKIVQQPASPTPQVISSSPPPIAPPQVLESSPPPEEPEFEMDISYSLRVNDKRAGDDHESYLSVFFHISNVENKMLAMIESPASGVNGREYRWQSRTVTFKAIGKKKGATYQHQTLEDFSFFTGSKLFERISGTAKYYIADRVEIRVEVRIQVEALQKALSRSSRAVNELSSPIPDTPANPRRTQQLLNEAKAHERVERVLTVQDVQSQLHSRWICHEPAYSNHPK
ncbi:hypothetical protein K469DRAFT_49607 [Zopfia rhizophila CBS 207.26]|uniref:Uncharacterized protein n=1 Tax=Zopfia rhizophila CBS 207.26 TaxID=1314779 RepID=A0A6A6EIY4_9PEZI|nr:hypothetical protein K469DRAFT_49607 [Zopfia rhizophila CBS 207.26]